MLALAFALALGPEPEVASTPSQSGELPHWQSVPSPPPKRKAEEPQVPVDGNGMLAFGSVLLGTGATLGAISLGLTIAGVDFDAKTRRDMAGVAGIIGLGSGAILLTLGLVTRGQFRRSAAGQIPDAPRTGNGMLLGGVGLIALGTGFGIHAIVDMVVLTCSSSGCAASRPIGAPVQLGLALGGIAVGAGLAAGGVWRRHGYERWARGRAQLQPSFNATPTSMSFGIAGRF